MTINNVITKDEANVPQPFVEKTEFKLLSRNKFEKIALCHPFFPF